jgi:hypothetical protein
MGKRRAGNHSPQKNNSIQDSVWDVKKMNTQFLTSTKQQ